MALINELFPLGTDEIIGRFRDLQKSMTGQTAEDRRTLILQIDALKDAVRSANEEIRRLRATVVRQELERDERDTTIARLKAEISRLQGGKASS